MVKMNNRWERLKKSSENVVVVTRKRPRPKIVKAVPVLKPKKEIKKSPANKENRPDRTFLTRVKNDLKGILPDKIPWKIRIDRELFHAIKYKYPGERTKLRRTIGSILQYRTNSLSYIRAMKKAECRYGINNEEFPLIDEHREACQEMIIKIKKKLKKNHLTRNRQKK